MTKILNPKRKSFRIWNFEFKYCFEFRNSNFGFDQQGQTLIETVVALFVLTTGLASGLSLAIFSFSSSTDVSRRITATGLAREGVEIVRRLRDSNWLAGTLTDCGGQQFCYTTWLNGSYDIRGAAGNGTEYRAVFNPASQTNKWTLAASDASSDYRLYQQAAGGFSHTSSAQPTQFFRKITVIYADTAAPYDAVNMQKVLVRSSVWWHDKRCPPITYLNQAGDNTHCKVVTEEYMTNWKNY